jgi:peptidoglycan/LPS O-acetylase OafA/YrhL
MLLGIVLHGLLSFTPIPIWPVQDNDQSVMYMIPLMFIHGFRMSLFFFVSGFFTRMMWEKRGTQSLLRHRTKRIILPFLIFGALIFPILNNMGAFVSSAATSHITEKRIFINPKYIIPDNLGGAARAGDLQKINGLLRKNVKINGKYDKGLTPLHWAAVMNQVDAIKLLVDNGANLNSRDDHQSTPLLLAAFFGHAESVDCLLQRGADVKLKNKDGALPQEAMMANRAITEWVAKDILKIPMEWNRVMEGRDQVNKLLGLENSFNKESISWFERNYFMFGQFCTHHLWFLYDLVYLTVGFVFLAWILKFLPDIGLAKWLAESPLRLLWLVPLTYLAQFYMGSGEDGVFGPATAVFLKPDWIKLGYYAVFFGYGAICFSHKGFHEKVGRLWPVYFALAMIVFIAVLTIIENKDEGSNYELISLYSSLFAWLMIFGLIGLFRKMFSQENKKVRFVSDSSYWLYIAHLPLIQIIQFWVSEWPLPSLIKLILVCIFTTVLLLLSYRYFIRYTPVGTLLNGKRFKIS